MSLERWHGSIPPRCVLRGAIDVVICGVRVPLAFVPFSLASLPCFVPDAAFGISRLVFVVLVHAFILDKNGIASRSRMSIHFENKEYVYVLTLGEGKSFHASVNATTNLSRGDPEREM